MPGIDGLEILRQIKAAGVASRGGHHHRPRTVDSAVEAMKQGAADYLSKPFSPDQFTMVLTKVWERSAWCAKTRLLRQRTGVHHGFEGIIGESRAMERVFALIRRVRPDRRHRADHRRERHGQGDGRPRDPPPQPPQRPPPAGLRLHGPGPHAAGKRALRPRQRLVLRGHRRQAGALRGGPRRHPLPRRSRQPQHGDPGEAAARAGDQAGPQGRRHGRTRGRTSASSPPPTATWPTWSRKASSARTSTTG